MLVTNLLVTNHHNGNQKKEDSLKIVCVVKADFVFSFE